MTSEMANLLVVQKNGPLIEEQGPVALIGVDEWKDERTGVGHVGADVQEVFEKPENGEGEAVGLTVKEEKGGTEERDDEFTESTAKDHDSVAKPTEEVMTAFMDGEIHKIREKEAGIIPPRVEEEEKIESKHSSATDAGNARPMIGAIEGELHGRSVAAGTWDARRIRERVAQEKRRLEVRESCGPHRSARHTIIHCG